jgi:osmotically-inducible protein OsmY
MMHNTSKTLRHICCALALVVLLPIAAQGCFGVALVGATTGALAVSDRRSIGVQTDDEAIELKAVTRLSKSLKDICHVNFTSYNRQVLLTGEAPNEEIKAQIIEEVRRIENVEKVLDELVIAGNSSIASRTNDSYITSKVKARFIDANQFSANHVKVVTEAGAVFLLGIVSEREAQAAAKIASHTSGVRKVVTVFQKKSDEEIRRIDQSLANSASSNK